MRASKDEDGVWLEAAVGIDDADHHRSRVPPLQQPGRQQVAVGGIESLTLAFPGVGRPALEEPHLVGIEATHDLGGGVVGTVVDDHHRVVRVGDGEQPLEAGADDQFLVQAGDHEHEEQAVGDRQPLGPGPAGEQEEVDDVEEGADGNGDLELDQAGRVDHELQRSPAWSRAATRPVYDETLRRIKPHRMSTTASST
jgi:hypothetical protein